MRCEADHKDGGVCMTPLMRSGVCPNSRNHAVYVHTGFELGCL